MLEIYIDPYKIYKKIDGVINDEKDFVLLWEEIIKWISLGATKKIAVRQIPLVFFFKNLKDVFGNNIKIISGDPKEIWEKTYSFRLYDDITDSEAAKLLSTGYSLKNKQTPYVETLLLLADINIADLDIENELINAILNGVEQKYPLTLKQALKEFVTIQPFGKKEVWQFISDSENKRLTLQKLIMTSIVKGYPSDSTIYKNYYLQSFYYKSFDFNADVAEHVPVAFKEATKEYLSSFKDLRIADFISGKIKEEWDIVLAFLNSNPVQEESTINNLLSKAQYFESVKEDIIEFLPTNPPQKTGPKADETIFNWLNYYFKYYKYSRIINKPELTEGFAQQFSDFFHELYLQKGEWLINNSVLAIKRIIEPYLKEKRPTLLLVIDGLGYEYAEELQKIFKIDVRMLFSTPPTKTKENKQRILSGLLDNATNYASILTENYNDIRWKESDSDKLSLGEFLKNKLDLYIYWENQFDRLIHNEMNYKKRFSDHKALIKGLYYEIKDFINNGGVAIITGDHGFTILPAKTENCIPLPEHFIETHRRIAYTDEEGKREIESNVYTHENTLIATGYSYFNSLPKGGTHGGLTPEEAVVPLIIIDKQPVHVIPLEFKLIEKPYYRRQNIQTRLIIFNPNSFNVVIDTLNILPNICSILEPISMIKSKTAKEFQTELNLKNVNQAGIILSIAYKINNIDFTDKIIVKTSGAMIEKDLEWD